MKPRWLKVTFVKEEATELLDLMAESGFMGLGTAYRGNEDRVIHVRAHDGKVELLPEQLAVWVEQGLISLEETASL